MFSERLKEVRKSKGLTLEMLAEMYNKKYDAGLNKGTLSKYENNKQEPMISVVDNLATLLGVSVDYLLSKEEISDIQEKKDKSKNELTKKDKKEIDEYIDEMRTELLQSNTLLFDGEPADEDDIETILSAIKIGAELIKKKNKEKYTPKKYKK